MAINLKQFGLNWTLKPDNLIAVPSDFKNKINNVSVSSSNIKFFGVNSNEYIIGGYLGGGTYGSVYECKRVSDGLECVIKIAKEIEAYALVKETLIQIIIVETTKNNKHPEIDFYGPYAPFLYDMAYDTKTNTGYIVSQKMRATVSTMIQARKDMNNEMIKATSLILIQLGTIISELYNTLAFNHRDFKTDNCMYIRDTDNRVQVRLIDFGFSFIKFNKMVIAGSAIDFKFNSLPRRDLTQFMYELYTYHSYLPDEIMEPLADMLTFPLKNKVCKMYNRCSKMKTWRNTYDFLNDDKVQNPNGDALVVKKVFMKVRNGLPYKNDLAWAPGMMGLFTAKPVVPIKTPAGKIYNPDTGHYVLVTGIIGRKLMAQINAAKPEDKAAVAAGLGIKVCKAPKPDYNPKTKRCVKGCDTGKKRNATFKCVRDVAAVSPRRREPAVCPEAKPNYNPKTKRCNKACPPGKKRNATFKCVTSSN